MAMDLGDVRRMHVELSTRCNATCPMCCRSPGGRMNPNLAPMELDLEQFRTMVPPSLLAGVEEIMFCGNYGDPAAASDALPILHHIRDVSPGTRLSLHTNGGLRSTGFWAELATVSDRVVFGIDGLEDTNHLYRQGVSWRLLVRNVESFIGAGGRATWCVTVFEHNEHQIDAMRDLAKTMGFTAIEIRRTNRFHTSRPLMFAPSDGPAPVTLRPPRRSEYRNSSVAGRSLPDRAGTERPEQMAELRCSLTARGEVYLDAHGRLFPCCYWGSAPMAAVEDAASADVMSAIERDERGLSALSLLTRSFEEVLQGTVFEGLPEAWQQGPGRNQMCADRCAGSANLESSIEALGARTGAT